LSRYRPIGEVRFSCIGCGRCCRGEPGAVFFTPDEGRRIAEGIEVNGERFTEEEFTKIFVTMKWGRPSLRERSNGDCVFYDAELARCKIYPLRPAQCALFPFWPSVMRSRESWDREAELCPGMNEGRLYTDKEIEALLALSPFEDL
jgi:Fe-S-cluster containining protein